ncbi:hypothetical protein ABL78_1153 [Leptomonas seymouri]|uniref:Uncharacterized protein n=1 Tax=Leptomonas seymouri TaxID=5684 RepID=A0A0N1I9C7_LEPSE|nr:hypothetical protein ABL78_1153 [Leptomonas seymouri]|eukprot:KPI89773.1 hypothetical protein ABL78_1153 [Leptomonas seymouri]
MAAQHSPRAPVMTPMETVAHNAHSGIDARTHKFLEDVWNNALRHAEESILTQETKTDALQEGRLRNAAGPSSSRAQAVPSGMAPSMSQVDATRLSFIPQAKENMAAPSPLPRKPLLATQADQEPCTSAPVLQPQRKPAQHQPVMSTRTYSMKVEAQPNLKRNSYTSHKGIAWVVQ